MTLYQALSGKDGVFYYFTFLLIDFDVISMLIAAMEDSFLPLQ